jgi:hypothetical protein
MKKFFLVALLQLVMKLGIAQTQLKTVEDLMQALKSGKTVTTVIYYGKCVLISDGVEQPKSPDAIGGMKLETFEYFDSSLFKGKMPSFVTSSQTILINHRRYGYVYNYVKIKIKLDGAVEITARYLKPKKFSAKFKVVMDETFKGKMNDESVTFFAK